MAICVSVILILLSHHVRDIIALSHYGGTGMKAIVIGSGIAGLTAGATLAKAGHQVTIFEQYHRPGGVTATIEKEGFQWDLGQLMLEGFGADEPIGQVLADLGILEEVPAIVDQRGYVFPDFELRTPQEYTGPKWRLEALKQKFPDNAKGLDKYWKDYVRLTRVLTFGRRLDHVTGLAKFWTQVRLYLALLPLLPKAQWSAEKLMAHYFQAEELKMVFTSILADFFTPPSEFQGLGVFMLNSELTFDKRVPKRIAPNADQLYLYSMRGGIKNLTRPLIDLIEAQGGEICTSSPVEKIAVVDGKVIGVEVSGDFYPADVVLASGDADQIFFKLVGKDNLPAEYVQLVAEQPLMDSVFMVHLGIDFDPSPYVHGPVTYYYGTYELEDAIREAQSGVYHEGRDGFVVHVPTMHSPEMAPEGRHALTVYTICPDTLSEGDWETRKEEFADKLIGYTEKYIPDLSKHIVSAEIFSPVEFRELTGSEHHAFGGLAPVMGKPRLTYRTPITGLWFIGQQS
ncbi:MAG: NAD(P)/FAD-dependent oxidoreductase, partial [Anaerolineales bacterium]|nr:NAD(P)/FAD-dependent oxidoreductase [Anaerolineales bacterium]